MNLNVSLDQSDVVRISQKLDALTAAVQARSVSRSLSRAVDKMKTEGVRAVQAELPALPRARIARAFKANKQDLSELSASLDVSRESIPLVEFAVGGAQSAFRRRRRARKKGESAPGLRPLPEGVFVRVKHGPVRVGRGFLQQPSTGGFGIFRRTGETRYPIEYLYGPSALSVFKKHAEEVGEVGRQSLLVELERQIDLALNSYSSLAL
jgi:hypothetical protein